MRMVSRTAALGLLLSLAGSQARAALLTVDLTGFFDPTTTLGGVALGADTAFSLRAMADTSTGVPLVPGLDVYAVTSLTIEIAGKGLFVGIPDVDTNLFLADANLDPS